MNKHVFKLMTSLNQIVTPLTLSKLYGNFNILKSFQCFKYIKVGWTYSIKWVLYQELIQTQDSLRSTAPWFHNRMASFAMEDFVGNGTLKELLPKLLEEGWDDVPTLKIMNSEDMNELNMTQQQKVG